MELFLQIVLFIILGISVMGAIGEKNSVKLQSGMLVLAIFSMASLIVTIYLF